MFVKKSGGKVFGAELTAAERKAMNIEIQRALAEYTRKHAAEIEAVYLWQLHTKLGFGHDRLKKFYTDLAPAVEALCERYEMTDDGDRVWMCTHQLKEIGVDVEAWAEERVSVD